MSDEVLKIDVDAVLRNRAARYYRLIPGWVVRWLERTVHQDELNDMLRRSHGVTGVEFAQFVLDDLDIKVHATGMEHLHAGQRYVFVANHPLGGLDGLALISLVGKRYDGRIRFLVNDLLMMVKPLGDVFLPVNKFGRQSREAAKLIDDEYRGDKQMLTFPAGLCSRLMPDGTVADLKWNKHVVMRAASDKRDVVPVHVDAHNSRFFYRLAQWRKRLGIKFNIEMLYLPDEMFKQRGATLHITVGKPIACDTLDTAHPLDQAARLRDIVYNLKNTAL